MYHPAGMQEEEPFDSSGYNLVFGRNAHVRRKSPSIALTFGPPPSPGGHSGLFCNRLL